MIEKIKSGYYKAELYKKRLCDVLIYVWSDTEPCTLEHITYNELLEVEDYLVTE